MKKFDISDYTKEESELFRCNESAKNYLIRKGILNSQYCRECLSKCKIYKQSSSLNHQYKCTKCQTYFSNTSNTFLHGVGLNFNQIFTLLRLWMDDFTPKQSLRILKGYFQQMICLCSIRRFFHRIMQAVNSAVKHEMSNTLLEGPCEIDESFIYKQKSGYLHARKYKTQCWLFGIKCRSTGKFVLYPVFQRNKDHLISIILRHVAHGSTIYSDCWSGYFNNRTRESHLSELGYVHYVVNHSHQFVSNITNSIHSNTIERLWGTLKSHIRLLRPKLYIDGHIAKYYLNSIYKNEGLYQKITDIMHYTNFVN